MGDQSDWTSDARLVRAFRPSSGATFDPNAWPATVPAAAHVLREGLELPPGITILVGENGSGKSTVIEMLAEAYGLNPQGGSILASALPARVRETEPGVGDQLWVERGPAGRAAWAYFLRADTMHSLYTYLEENPGRARHERLHELSHGQGFIEILLPALRRRVGGATPIAERLPINSCCTKQVKTGVRVVESDRNTSGMVRSDRKLGCCPPMPTHRVI